MTKPHTTLSEAVRALPLQKRLADFNSLREFQFYCQGFAESRDAILALVEQHEAQEPVAHPDDLAVDRFAVAMKTKMAASRAKGRSGWDDESRCTMGTLARLLMEHVAKGDPVDIANFAMMLHQREVAAMEHHPCYGGGAAKAIKTYAQPTLAATQAGDAKVISIGHGATLQRQAKTTGAVGWLMYNEHGLVRSLDAFETQLVESTLAAMSPTTTRSE